METTSLYLIALALLGIGCAATVLSAQIVPLSVRVRGQAHGRFAGLSAAQTLQGCDGKPQAGGPGAAVNQRRSPGLIVA